MTQTQRDDELDHLLLAPDFTADPYPAYHVLRERDPVHWSEPWGCWLLTRYADVVASLRDPPSFSNSGRFRPILENLPPETRAQVQPLERHFERGLLNVDPPDHTRMRTLINKSFTPRAVAAMVPAIQQLVDQCLDQVQDQGRLDVIRDLAFPLPVIVVARMMGVPPADRDQFKEWSTAIVAFQATGRTTPDTVRRSQVALLAMRDYLRAIAHARRQAPRDDLISAMVAAEEQGDTLSEEELLSTCVTMMIAGHETTTNLIATGLLNLLRHPAQLAQLRADPALVGSAVEELLRYDSPLQRNRRVVTHDLEFGGKQMKRGQPVVQLLGAANRDPAQFADPDRLDLRRSPNAHLAFGRGVHFCLGAPLARLEAPIAHNAILRRLPGLQLATDELQWQHERGMFRGLAALPLLFDA
jgi:pimeloyl-[acyl-carrier protein] synthase